VVITKEIRIKKLNKFFKKKEKRKSNVVVIFLPSKSGV
jgi:hypothetical protein